MGPIFLLIPQQQILPASLRAALSSAGSGVSSEQYDPPSCTSAVQCRLCSNSAVQTLNKQTPIIPGAACTACPCPAVD